MGWLPLSVVSQPGPPANWMRHRTSPLHEASLPYHYFKHPPTRHLNYQLVRYHKRVELFPFSQFDGPRPVALGGQMQSWRTDLGSSGTSYSPQPATTSGEMYVLTSTPPLLIPPEPVARVGNRLFSMRYHWSKDLRPYFCIAFPSNVLRW